MNWKGIMRGAVRVIVAAAPTVAAVSNAAGVPLVGAILNAVLAAETVGGSGPEKFGAALRYMDVAAPLVIDQLEKQLGVDIPDDAAADYVRVQVQAHVDLLNACGVLPRKGV